ncbi:nuclear transcription factor Y subunit gamma-like [Artemia franciscana]
MSNSPEPININDETQKEVSAFWVKVNTDMQNVTSGDFKNQDLPLARIKKIMKLDEDVKMISAEAPLLFAKAAEIFINELTLRAWIHTEDNKRRTLQRNDIAMAITKFDMFDFLIDIVPREEIKPSRSESKPQSGDQVQYYLQLAQQNQQALQSTNAATPQTIQIMQPGGQVQTISVVPSQTGQTIIPSVSTGGSSGQPQIVQLQTGTGVNQIVQHANNGAQNNSGTSTTQANNIQIVQQVIGPNGEITQVPVQLTPQQHQAIRMQLGNLIQGQQVIIQTANQQGEVGVQQQQVIQVQQIEQ